MKKVILLVAVAVSLTFSANAQISMNSAGEVSLGNYLKLWQVKAGNGKLAIDWAGNYYGENGTFEYGLTSGSHAITKGRDLRLEANSGSTDPGDIVFKDGNGNEAVRIFTFTTSNLYIRGNHGGYGGIRMNLSTENVGIKTNPSSSYEFYVNGDAYATSGWISSDLRGKENVENMDAVYTNKLMKLKGAKYNLKAREGMNMGLATSEAIVDSIVDDVSLNSDFYSRKRIGFIAQEVKEIYPELVKEDENGYLAINYDGFIPIIIESLKNQQKEIENKENELEDCLYRIEKLEEMVSALQNDCCDKNTKSNLKSAELSLTNADELVINSENSLEQNIPNPFTESTQIKYFITENVRTANLYIYNMNGTQLKSIQLHQKGNGSVTINGGEFKAGMYMYTLIADGQVIDTKQMILTD
jgi:hypothetical protein